MGKATFIGPAFIGRLPAGELNLYAFEEGFSRNLFFYDPAVEEAGIAEQFSQSFPTT